RTRLRSAIGSRSEPASVGTRAPQRSSTTAAAPRASTPATCAKCSTTPSVSFPTSLPRASRRDPLAVAGDLQLDEQLRATRPAVPRRDRATDAAHRALREPQAEPGPRGSLGGEERLEQPREVRRRDSRPLV